MGQMKEFKVLICGGRDFRHVNLLNLVLDKFHAKFGFTTLIHGGAAGADYLSEKWAIENKILSQSFPADWGKHGKSAGYIRNKAMANQNPDLVIAFPGGKGTEMMINIAKQRNLKVVIIEFIEEEVSPQQEKWLQTNFPEIFNETNY